MSREIGVRRDRRPKSRCHLRDARTRDWELSGNGLPFLWAGAWAHPHQGQSSRESLGGQTVTDRRHRHVQNETLTNPDDLLPRKGSQANRTSSIRHKIKERPDKRYDPTVGCDAICNCTHSVLTDTIANVSAPVTAKPRILRLEFDGTLDLSKVAARQVCRAAKEVWKGRSNCREDDLR